MKKIKLLLGLFLVISLFSCNDSDDTKKITSQTLNENWMLLKSSGTIAGVMHEFPEGTITWKFHSNGTVTIVNNNTDSTLLDGLDSGTYPYTITDNPNGSTCAKTIFINGIDFDCFSESNGEMNIGQTFADGVEYYLVKEPTIVIN